MAGGWLATDKTTPVTRKRLHTNIVAGPSTRADLLSSVGMEFARAASSHSFEPGFELKPGEVDTGVSAPARSRALARSRAAP